MARTSSLLKTASARRAAIQQEQNRLADMQWNLSAMTQDDFAAYVAHYDKASQSALPSDQIAYTNKIISARRSFASNEIQRATINTLEGNGTNDDKLNTMIGLYQSAVDNGDLNLAQNLNAQIDSLYQTVANEKQAQMTLATQAYNSGFTSAKDYVAELKAGTASPFADDPQVTMQAINNMLTAYGPEETAQVVQQLSAKYGIPMASFEDLALYLANNTVTATESLRDQYAPGSAEYKTLDNNVTELKTKDVFQLPGVKLTLDQLTQTAENARLGVGGGAISLISTDKGYQFTENKISSWTATIGADGQLNMVPNYVSSGDIRAAAPGSQTTSQNAGTNGYNLVTDSTGTQYAVDAQGNMYNATGLQVKNGKITSKKVGNIKDYQPTELNQVKQTTEKALNNLGYKADANNVYIQDANGNEIGYQYKVDNNGNVQFYQTYTDPNTGKISKEIHTIDMQTGQRATATGDFLKMQAENKRLAGISANSPSMLQGVKNSAQIVQPSGASALLQQSANINAINKANQIQATATAAQISAAQNQPLKVQPIQTQPALSVTPTVAPRAVVAPATPQPNVVVSPGPITQGTTPRVVVNNTPSTQTAVVSGGTPQISNIADLRF